MNDSLDDDGRGCLFAIAIPFVILVFGAIAMDLGRHFLLTGLLGAAGFVALPGLLAVWLVFGGGPIGVRIMLATLPCIAMALLLLASANASIAEKLFGAAMLALLIPLLSAPSIALRALGYRLVQTRSSRAMREVRIDTGPLQFSLRYLMGLTAAIAVYAFLVKKIGGERLGDGLMVLNSLGVIGVSAAGGAWAAWGQASPVARVVLVCIGGGIVTSAAFAPFISDVQVALTTATFGAMTSFVMSGALLLYRGLGYRLLRVQTKGNMEGDRETDGSPN